MLGIFLDDVRYPEEVKWIQYPDNIKWKIVRNFFEFKQVIDQLEDNYQPFVVSFDHDLNDFFLNKERTGKTCLEYLIMCFYMTEYPIPSCYFHTMNPDGEKRMKLLYQDWKDGKI